MINLNLLEIICSYKHFEIARDKKKNSLKNLQKLLKINPYKRKQSLKQAIIQSSTGIIAEFKRHSPSKGWIFRDAKIEEIIQGYQTMGAAAISVLTNETFFGASPYDFIKSRNIISKIPLLRKDFIIDEYQIYQSKMIGADAILLIASCLTSKKICLFTEIAHQLDMEVILEIHTEKELEFIYHDVDIIGINNRDLKTFSTNIYHTIKLVEKLPKESVKISESGISSPQSITLLKQSGINGFIIGEYFMKKCKPAETLRKFISKI